MRQLALMAALLALASCAGVPATRHAGVEQEVRKAEAVKTIRIASVPPGCIVELNGEYIGQTPFSLTVDADPNGCWPRYYPNGSSRAMGSRMVCTAPSGTSEYRSWVCGERIPDMVLFRPCGGRYPVGQPLQLGMNTGS